MKRAVVILVAGWGMLASLPAHSGPFRMVGYDTCSLGQAGIQGIRGGGLGALYGNPALLTDLKEQFGFGFLLLKPSLYANPMSRPVNADVPITFYDSDVGIEGANLDRPLPTAELQNPRSSNQPGDLSGFMVLGLAHSLGIKDFMLGLTILLPGKGLTAIRSYYPDEREQYFTNTIHFTRFGEWSQVFSLLFGAGYRPLPWLQAGVSLETSLVAAATLDAYIPEATVQDYALANVGFDTTPTARAIIGVTVRPLEMLSFSLVWRDRRFFKVNADAILKLWNYHEAGEGTQPKRVAQSHNLAIDFEPMEVSLSAGIQLGTLSAVADVTWNHWSDYLGTHHKRAQQDAVFEPTNLGEIPVNGDPFAFSDTFSFSLGVTWEYLTGCAFTSGAGYHPTPVPPQTGRTNFVDNDLLSLALGHRLELTLWERALRLDAGVQFWTMFEQTVHKDPELIKDEFADHAKTLIGGQDMPEAQGLQTNNPGFPGYTFGGWALVGALSLSYFF